MTRVTNFGIKRTYVEARFSEETQQTPATTPAVPHSAPQFTSTTAEGNSQPPKKKKKRSGKATPSDTPAPVPRKHPRRHRPKKKLRDENGEIIVPEPKPEERPKEGGKPTGAGEVTDVVSQAYKARREKKKDLANKRRETEYTSPGEQRRLQRIKERAETTTCFACREKGHAARDCPKAATMTAEGGEGQGNGRRKGAPSIVGVCYRCGSIKHNLSRCRELVDPENPLPFASCFVCSEKGHLAGACPQNEERGVYPNGGRCMICGDKSHLAKDCTSRKNDLAPRTAVGTGMDAGADEDDFMAITRRTKQVEKAEKKEEQLRRIREAMGYAPVPLRGPTLFSAKTAKKVVF